jgi:hypothetical protein
MGLIVLSSLLAIVLGSCLWLVLGDRFPLKQEDKWPTPNNILIYAVMLVIPVYLAIFIVY